MSRQYDAYMEGKFEIYGECYEIVVPDGFDSLLKAIEVKDAIETYLSGLMHDEEPGCYEELLQEQVDNINSYLEQLGEFDNSLLSSNISYLAKRNSLRMGDIERMLGISAGYISRTTKEGSAKRLSIDVVWKLAKLFEISINTLINEDLRTPGSNTDLLIKFLAKMRRDTNDGKITWIFEGGYEYEVSQRFIDMKLVSDILEDDEGVEYTYRYFPSDHLNPDLKWYIAGSIICCENFNGNKDLVIVPVAHEKREGVYCVDCYLVEQEQGTWKWQKVFYSCETPMSKLDYYAKLFYDEIIQIEFDDKIETDVKGIITDYLKGV